MCSSTGMKVPEEVVSTVGKDTRQVGYLVSVAGRTHKGLLLSSRDDVLKIGKIYKPNINANLVNRKKPRWQQH